MKKKVVKFEDYKKSLFKDEGILKMYKQMEPEYELISAVINYRISMNMSQKDLAKQVGTKQSAISRFESGKSNPSLQFMQKIARGLGRDLRIILL